MSTSKAISQETMQRIYEQIKTPYKFGKVIFHDDYKTDSPSVFRYNGKWYMYYIRIHNDMSKSGYETHLASSDDLVHWTYEYPLLRRSEGDAWDSKQIAGYLAFADTDFGGSNEPIPVNGSYYVSYLAGNLNGYETDPLLMGLAKSNSPIEGLEKFKDPIMTPFDADVREFECKTLFKSNLFIDEARTLGHRYVMAYNAKPHDDKERIYLAVSDDAEHWTRYGKDPILNEVGVIPNLRISGDPQIVKIDGLYVMFFFRYVEGGKAYNTFAVSRDLVDWTLWEGEPLVQSEEEWENVHAHKSYVVKAGGVVYHYYCAVNSKGDRFIALAASEPVWEK